MASTSLKKFYLDDVKLAQMAWLEFTRSMRTGRTIAFLGSMASEAFGYCEWGVLVDRYIKIARNAVAAVPDNKPMSDWLEAKLKPIESSQARASISASVIMGLVEEIFDNLDFQKLLHAMPGDDWPLDECVKPSDILAQGLAKEFRMLNKPIGGSDNNEQKKRFESKMDAISLLFDDLDIHRFATTNYDFEIERKTMLRDQPGWDGDKLTSPFYQLKKLREAAMRPTSTDIFDWNLGSGRIRRVLSHGKAAESDLLNRERIDRLIEFAIGADDVDSHVMHLHGRACNWRSMIVTQRDYDALYRRNDLNRLPFEYAKRLMMGGNPILFVGLGMSEAEVNRELQEFVSNNPYHRSARTFLLWSAVSGGLKEPDARLTRRLDWLHRLGVLTIFDTDFGPDLLQDDPALRAEFNMLQEDSAALTERLDLANTSRVPDRAAELEALACGVRGAVLRLKTPVREDYIGNRWRTSQSIKGEQQACRPEILWEREDKTASAMAAPKKLLTIVRDDPLTFVLGPRGCGKGSAALALARKLAEPGNPCLLINGGFSFDTDSMLNGIKDFLARAMGVKPKKRESRSEFFARLARKNTQPTIHIVLNGAERFFAVSGNPISAELDELLQFHIPRVHWTIFGTDRIQRYAKKLCGRPAERFADFYRKSEKTRSKDEKQLPAHQFERIRLGIQKAAHKPPETLSPGDWRNVLAEASNYRAHASGRLSGDIDNLRKAFYSWALDNNVVREVVARTPPIDCADAASWRREAIAVAQQMLRVLAFFGLPVEMNVLKEVAALKPHATHVGPILVQLVEIGLVLEIRPYEAYDDVTQIRYVLHRSLLTELRSRFGIPLTEAKLSTSFNMSLYVAQPLDGYIPEPEIHDELGEIIDDLLGAYRTTMEPAAAEIALDDLAREWGVSLENCKLVLAKVARACQHARGSEANNELVCVEHLCRRANVQRLRGALAVVRGYYSTTGILTLDNGDRLVSEDRDGILREHAERLDRLIDAKAKMSMARAALQAALKTETGSDSIFQSHYGRGEPLYADELVWLHNERGVVCLAMGDLYEARASFGRAMKVNHGHVEYDYRGHNWRRIRLNQLTLTIEMGDIGLGERMAKEIIDVSKLRDPKIFEDRLSVAIAEGHLGWCRHLQGEYAKAIKHYKTAISELRSLDEVRAEAYFHRLRVDAQALTATPDQARRDRERALDLAQSTRQMDLVYRMQVSLAFAYFSAQPTDAQATRRVHRLLDDALQYALQTDVHRVRCDASMTLARIRCTNGDYEGALRFASDALMIANRYGMELRKITLRADIARIMAARGHPVTAQNLAKAAVSIASRIRFQTALDRAEQVLLDIPQLSAAIGGTDSSGRRDF